MRVSIVIPTWNGLGDLQACIASIDRQTGVEVELMVVDNGSEDDSVVWLEESGIKNLSLPRNLGFAVAVNLGVAHTEAPLVLVLNSDTVLEPDCLEHLVAALDADPSLGGVQPRILQLVRGQAGDPDDPEAIVYSLGQALTADGRARETAIGQAQGPSPIAPREIFGLCGAACLFRREAFESLGGYDEQYFAFYEDVDLNVRARIAGWKFRLAPEAVVWHVGNAAWNAGFERPDAENARLVARNRLSTQVKFMPLGSLPRIMVIESGALVRATRERRLMFTVAGKVAALLRLPYLLRGRQAVKSSGDLELARQWLGESKRGPAEILRHPVPPPGVPEIHNY